LIKKKEETNDDNKENESDKPLVPPPKLILHNNLIELFNSIQSVTKDAQLIEDIFKLNSALVNTILVNCQNIIHLQLYHGQVVDTRVKLILNQITPNESSQYEVVATNGGGNCLYNAVYNVCANILLKI